MTTTNHFRGRHLGTNLRSPVSPRPHHFTHGNVEPVPPPIFNLAMNFNGTNAGINDTFSFAAQDLPQTAINFWEKGGVTNLGNLYTVQANWGNPSTSLGMTIFITRSGTDYYALSEDLSSQLGPIPFSHQWLNEPLQFGWTGTVTFTITLPNPWHP